MFKQFLSFPYILCVLSRQNIHSRILVNCLDELRIWIEFSRILFISQKNTDDSLGIKNLHKEDYYKMRRKCCKICKWYCLLHRK